MGIIIYFTPVENGLSQSPGQRRGTVLGGRQAVVDGVLVGLGLSNEHVAIGAVALEPVGTLWKTLLMSFAARIKSYQFW